MVNAMIDALFALNANLAQRELAASIFTGSF